VPAAPNRDPSFDGVDLLLDVELGASSPGAHYSIHYLAECDSTNSELLNRARLGATHASVLLCERQTAGRGRRGRSWLSSPGASLTFSLLWRFDEVPGALGSLSLVVAVAVARALETSGASHVMLKWPNDLWFDGRKLGGILIESMTGAGGACAVVIGIGLNVRVPAELRDQLDHPIADLHEAGCVASRPMLLGGILGQLARDIPRFSQQGFGPFLEEWRSREVMRGEPVVISNEGGLQKEGELLGVGADGSLRVRCEGAVQEFRSGELSLRRA
jgi:BirA family transcriptional regulator, biotin operon repressor / biotin---[acetyl-CoA-carboxylase] ligase